MSAIRRMEEMFADGESDSTLIPPIVAESTYGRKGHNSQTNACRKVWNKKKTDSECDYDSIENRPILMRGAHFRVMEYRNSSRTGRPKYITELVERYMSINKLCIFSIHDARWLISNLKRLQENRKANKRSSYRFGRHVFSFSVRRLSEWERYDYLDCVLYGRLVEVPYVSYQKVCARLNKIILELIDMEKEYVSPLSKIENTIASPKELRRHLLDTIVGVIEGRITVAQANAVASNSAEVHKSIKQEWDMQVYAVEHLDFYDIKQIEKS